MPPSDDSDKQVNKWPYDPYSPEWVRQLIWRSSLVDKIAGEIGPVVIKTSIIHDSLIEST